MKVIHLSVRILNNIEDDFYIVLRSDGTTLFYNALEVEWSTDIVTFLKPKKIITVNIDSYMFFILESALRSSNRVTAKFVNYVTSYLCCKSGLVKIIINLTTPKQYIIDKRGGKLFETSYLERRELDNAMAWFSTLGGAFSALGDGMEHCAIMAGKISQQQFLLALRLGDPTLVARCKLYMALSLIQQKKFSQAKNLIKSQYAIAKLQYERDRRLMSMCLGIWTKWNYDKKKAKLEKKAIK